jgi:N-acetyl-anhydromuramyl-L-alanine amidase AmpD
MAARSEVVLLEAGGSQGTGFLIAPGLLVTALHVVAEFDDHGRAVVDDAGLPFSYEPASKRSKRPQNAALDAVVLHQMSLSRGDDPQRYVRVTSHFVSLPDGLVVQLHPLSARLLASNGFNQRSVAIEFAGNLQSTNGKWWRPEKYGRDKLTAAQVESGRKLLRLLAGQGIRFVFGHRQSSADRGNDPGPEIWPTVAQWAIDQLGVDDGRPDYAIDSGRPIPEEWRTFSLDKRVA